MPEKLLIIGQGFLGDAIFSAATNLQISVTGTHRTQIDVRNVDSIEKIVTKTNPDIIINCAALTNVDELESNPDAAYAVNAHGAKNTAIIAHKKKIKLIHISTDSVFDGEKGFYSEEDVPQPVNIYGKSKKLGEDLVRETIDNHLIVRTNFYGHNKDGKFLFDWILQNLRKEQPITAFHDVIFNPLEVRNLANIIIELMSKKIFGIIHIASNEIMNKYEFAANIANALNLRSDLINKGSVKDAHFIAKRPLNTSLDNTKARRLLKTEFVRLQEWLKGEFQSQNI